MKKFYFALVLTLFVLPFFAQNIPSYVPKDGLVGYWPFNGNANDESGNGNHGTNNGATLTEDRNGVANSAYNFEGLNNYIDILNLNNDKLSQDFTISSWINIKSFDALYPQVVNGDNNYIAIQLGGSGYLNDLKMYKKLIFYFSPGPNYTKSNNDLKTDNYYFITSVRKADSIFLFINGEKQIASNFNNANIASGNYIRIGSYAPSVNSDYNKGDFDGKIDEISIYNRALSEQEISGLYTEKPIAQNIPSYVPKYGLVGYWPFNGNANDESGNGNHGTVNGATLSDDRSGKPNSAFSFDGKSSIDVLSSSSLNSLSKSYTISAWTYIKSWNNVGAGHFPIMDKNTTCINTAGSTPYLFVAANNKEGYHIQNINCGTQTLVGSSGLVPTSSKWTNIVATYDNALINIYIDGELVSSKPNTGQVIQNNSVLTFGKATFGASPQYAFGQIDDITIYNRALSKEEITNLFLQCNKDEATSSSFNTMLLNTGNTIEVLAIPSGGTFSSNAIKNGKFDPTIAKIGANKVQYNFKNSKGCYDSTLFTMIVADTVGTTCKKYDTITVTNNITKYDTVTVKNNVYDTVTVTNNVTKYDTVKVNTYDTITITNNVTKYDTVIVKTNVFDTVKVNTYDTITLTNTVTKYDTITVTDTVNILKINFKLTTGIKANQMTSMSIYPNPTSDVLIIDASDLAAVTSYSYRILDVLGKEVYNVLVTAAKTEISLKTFGAKGMYVLHILDANKLSVQTKQIILE